MTAVDIMLSSVRGSSMLSMAQPRVKSERKQRIEEQTLVIPRDEETYAKDVNETTLEDEYMYDAVPTFAFAS